MTRVFRGGAAPLLFLAGLIALLYADILFFGRGLYMTDLTSYHYPMKSIVRNVISSGDFPYWNRLYSAGQPMAANPAYEIFYPLQWLIFLPSYHFGFQLHILVHFFIAAAGIFLLARSLGIGLPASLFASVSFVLGGPYLSLSTRLPLLFSLSWLPFALYFARRFLIERRWTLFAGASAVVALQMIIGEPTIAAQTWLLILAYAIYHALKQRGAGFSRRKSRSDKNPRPPADAGATSIVRLILLCAAIFVMAALLAAVQILPGFDHARDSVRAQSFEFRVASNWSLPIGRPLEFAWPSIFRNLRGANGQPAITSMYPFRTDAFLPEVYLGLLVVILAVSGLFAGVKGRGVALLLTFGALFVAWGEHTPLLRLLYEVGLFRNIRYPEKFVITAAIVLLLWAAVVLDRLLAGDRKVGGTAAVVAAMFCAAAFLVALAQSGHVASRMFFIGNAGRAVAALALIWFIRKKRDGMWPAAILIAAVILDLWIAMQHVVPRMPRQYFDAPPIVEKIPATGRVYHEAAWEVWDATGTAYAYFGGRALEDFFWIFRNGAFPNLAARWNRELALEDDIDQTALSSSAMFLEALKITRRGGPGADEGLLALSNVTSRLRFRPSDTMTPDASKTMPVEVVPVSGSPRYTFARRLESVASSASGFASQARGRVGEGIAFVPFEPFDPAPGDVISAEEGVNGARLRVKAVGRAYLVASVTNHKWWSASIDGQPLPIATTNLAYQGFVIPPGDHVVTLRYRNPLVGTGAWISAIALALLIGVTSGVYLTSPEGRNTLLILSLQNE